jgi:hypothetical protein
LSASVAAQIALTLELTIEFPVFVAFHPTTLCYPGHINTNVPFPTLPHAFAQITTFFLVDSALKHYVLPFLAPDLAGRQKTGSDLKRAAHPDELVAFDLATQFIRTRGALLLVIALLGTPSALSAYTGKFHVLSMVGWAAVL